MTMKTGTFTKLLFTGVTAGIALSCAIVLATSVSPSSKTDWISVERQAEPEADRVQPVAVTQEVVRTDKSDALDITIAILKGDDILPGDREPFVIPNETAAISAPETTATPDETTASAEETPDVSPATVAATEPARQVIPAPRRITTIETPGGPVNIIPTPQPVESQPVASPTTTTNFTTEPIGTLQDIRDRSDLAR